MQDREIVFRNGPRPRIAPFALGVLVQRFVKERDLAIGEPIDGARPDALDAQPVSGLDRDFQRRAAEPVEQQAAEGVETIVTRNAEADEKLEFALRLEIRLAGAFVEFVFQFRQRVLVEFGFAQLQHGLDGRHHAVPARFRKQRRVIALGLVIVGARQIDELRPAGIEQARAREIFAGCDHLVGGIGVREVLGLIDENDPTGHAWSLDRVDGANGSLFALCDHLIWPLTAAMVSVGA